MMNPSEQFGFAVHQWGLHAGYDDKIIAMVEPLPHLYTCGEAFSDYQVGLKVRCGRCVDLVLKRVSG
ncbi:MAG: hypothetical protein R2911_41250 [Caldilineaceae bacterium]